MSGFVCVFLFTFHFSFFTPVFAFDRTNVPLKNWGGFAVNRSWVYDALEKIVLAGLADQVLLNTKPLSRVEVARIVAQAVRRIQFDQSGDYNHRGNLENLLYQLVREFGAELTEMGVKTPLNRKPVPGFFHLRPIEHMQSGIDLATSSRRSINSFGRPINKGANPISTFDGSVQVGDFLSFYYQPEFSRNDDSNHGGLLSGYGKLTWMNTELLVGRESIWWGPGFRGSMSFSSNGFPLDQVRLSSAEPFRLPWIFKHLGPVKLTGFIAELDKDRVISKAKVGAWRIDFAPADFLELGFSRVFQFGGKGRGTPSAGQFAGLFFGQGSDNPNSAAQVNNVMALDMTLRIPNAQRYLLITRDLTFYGELGYDDTKGILPGGIFLPDKPGGIVGLLLAGFLGDPKLDLRLEYATTSDIQFTHFIFRSGFSNRGSVLSHFIGTDGDDLYARVTRWVTPDLLLGFQASRSHIGRAEADAQNTPLVLSQSFGFDLSYRFSPSSSIFLGYDFVRSQDADRAGGSGFGSTKNDNFLRFEFNRSFDW